MTPPTNDDIDVRDDLAGADDDDAGTTAAAAAPNHRRRRGLLVAGGVVVVLVLLAAWFTFGGQRAQQSSEDQARLRVAPAGSSPATAAPGPGPLTAPPTPGLYRYRGTGHEETSFPPLAEEQGPAMPGTVILQADGCWRLQIDYNTHHWQGWTYCTVGGQLTETGSTSFSRRNIGGADIDNSSEFTCQPAIVILTAADRAGVTRPQSCTGKGTLVPEATTSAGTTTVVGPETIDVGGQSVETMHVRYDLTYTGGQSGTETTDVWLATTTGMPVRNEHHIEVATVTPFGRITYKENAELVLQTPAPV